MKKVICALLFFAPYMMMAQSVCQPFLKEGKSWNYSCSNSKGPGNDRLVLTVKGDTVVNGHECFKLYMNDRGQEGYFAAACERDKKVCYYLNGSTDEKVWYDFSWETGDSIYAPQEYLQLLSDYLYLNQIDTVEVDGNSFRRLTFYGKTTLEYPTGADGGIDDWIWTPVRILVEGVGSPFLADASHRELEGLPLDCGIVMFRSCSDGGQVIFDNWAFYKTGGTTAIAPPVADKDQTSDGTVYSLGGQRITGTPTRGIYVKGGRKYIAR